jgi:hypothetical protein
MRTTTGKKNVKLAGEVTGSARREKRMLSASPVVALAHKSRAPLTPTLPASNERRPISFDSCYTTTLLNQFHSPRWEAVQRSRACLPDYPIPPLQHRNH